MIYLRRRLVASPRPTRPMCSSASLARHSLIRCKMPLGRPRSWFRTAPGLRPRT